VAVGIVGAVAPAGAPTGKRIDVGIVQGGGRRGFRAIETNPDDVYAAHVAASDALLRRPLDLVLWPEDVIAVDGDVAASQVATDLGGLARDYHATVVAGVVEGEGTDHFRNAAVAWSPAGDIVGRYEKVHRVPFGEYVPFRSLVDKVADLSAVPDDAIVGHGPNVLATPAGTLGVAISYEVFFADRGREATRKGAGVLLVPTNAASFKTTQVPTQEVAAARLLATASGRSVLQAGPTGYSAVITHDGRVRQRSILGRRQVLHDRISLRRGRTVYGILGDLPLLLASLALVLTAWSRRR
jgi:apolipoprotein N-acyltransferase